MQALTIGARMCLKISGRGTGKVRPEICLIILLLTGPEYSDQTEQENFEVGKGKRFLLFALVF